MTSMPEGKSKPMSDYDAEEARRLLANYADEHPPDNHDPHLLEERTRAGEELLKALKKLNTAGIVIEDHPQKPGWLLMRFPRRRTALAWSEHGEVFIVVSLEEEPKRVDLYYNRFTKRLEGKDEDKFQPTPRERYPVKRSALAVVVEAVIAMLPA